MITNLHSPNLQIRSKSIIFFNKFEGSHVRKKSIFNRKRNFSDKKTYSGEVTHHARKRIAKSISLLNQSSPWQLIKSPFTGQEINFKLSFITLTIPDSTYISGSDAYKLLLKPFLRKCKSKFGMNSYVWKAELQERGQIHYHITSNTFIEYSQVQEIWNNQIRQNGLMSEYTAATGSIHPHSTEIKSVKNVADIEAYLVKYICKSDDLGRVIKGKIWGCSENLKGASYFSDILNETNRQLINTAIKAKKAVFKSFDHYAILICNALNPLDVLSIEQRLTYKRHIFALANSVP